MHFLELNVRISLKDSLKFVPKVRINNIPALVQIMACRRPGDKPLSESMMVSLPTHICVTRPQWVNTVMPFTQGRYLCSNNIFVCLFIFCYFFSLLGCVVWLQTMNIGWNNETWCYTKHNTNWHDRPYRVSVLLALTILNCANSYIWYFFLAAPLVVLVITLSSVFNWWKTTDEHEFIIV